MVAIFLRRKDQSTHNGGCNWWPLDTIKDGIGFGSMIYHHGLTAAETLFKQGNDRWRMGQKPLELMRMIVTLMSRPGDTVLDLFAGTGTTLLAAQMESRHYVGVEMDRHVVRVAKQRLSPYHNDGIAAQLTQELADEHHLMYEQVGKPTIANLALTADIYQ